MTSGEFQRIPLERITVVREERLRKKISPTYIEELADTIRQHGPIHPPVVFPLGNDYFKLVVGECRFEAYKLLAWDAAMFQITNDPDYSTHRAIELAENIRRKDVTWQEQRDFVTEWHEIKESEDPSWTQEKTGLCFGLDQSMVSKYLQITEEVREHGNLKLLEQDKLETALNMMNREKERRGDKINFLHVNETEKSKQIINADFLEWAPAYTGPTKFNFLHCDFPYGIGTDKRQQGTGVAVHGTYDDSNPVYWRLLDALCTNLNRICAESAHIMFWFSMHNYCDTLDYFANHTNFEMDPFPLVWQKSDGKGLLPDPQRGPRRIYETCLFGSRGDRKIVKSKANACFEQTVTGHLSVKPEPVLRHFFQMFVDENTIMLDPTCGSGSAVRAAEALGAPRILGIELDPEFADLANIELAKSRRNKSAA
jgi:ParB-like nuclease domain/DNA methylase